MKLGLTYQELGDLFPIPVGKHSALVDQVSIDTRTIADGSKCLFVALSGQFRDGHEFITDAYEKGVRVFLLEKNQEAVPLDALTIVVPDTLAALQMLARYHRDKFDIPIIAITGSAGKTIVKEWLAQLLSLKYRIVRSPKSYNSQIGVALSLMEICSDTQLAIIEAGISQPGEMDVLQQMIRPTHGILTSIGTAHLENFMHAEQLLKEKLKLFKDCHLIYFALSTNKDLRSVIQKELSSRCQEVNSANEQLLNHMPLRDSLSLDNAALAVAMAKEFGVGNMLISDEIRRFEHLAMRLETFEGSHDNLIINDSYSLDPDAFRYSLEYQLSIAGTRNRWVIVGLDKKSDETAILNLLNEFGISNYQLLSDKTIPLPSIQNSVVLFKGSRNFRMEELASGFRQKKHETCLEIDLRAIRENLTVLKNKIPANCQILAMVKASSYGSGGDKMAQFLERSGVAFLGVAYADEGVHLREIGVTSRILVMNAEESSFEDCIKHRLEPAIYSNRQLEKFIRQVLYLGLTHYPIHIKLETGMKRLGFEESDLSTLQLLLQAQPEVRVSSIYSHLSDADSPESEFVHLQAKRFEAFSKQLLDKLPYSVMRHLLNSEGTLNYPEYHYDMVRIGIGLFGYSPNEANRSLLSAAIRWNSRISQIKEVRSGESVGYGQESKVRIDTRIAIIPVGYADGFRRNLSKGVGGVVIQNKFCPTVGNVCMDMIMVDLGDLPVTEGEAVEIIGKNQSIERLAEMMQSIPYEVLTSISPRVQRLYIEI